MEVERNKKAAERHIFDLVYAGRQLHEILPHENPDFLVRQTPRTPYFGVEVTEYHVSETSARLDRLDGYTTTLLNGGDFRHKDDPKHVEVAKVDIVRPDDTIHAKDVPVIIQKIPLPATCAGDVAERIISKAKRVAASTAEVFHTNLIIEDRTGVLRAVPSADFYRVYFVPGLISAVRASAFREIFLVTTVEGQEVYVPLKMLHLLAEAYLFAGAMEESGAAARIPAEIKDTEVFAAYFNEVTDGAVLIHRQDIGVEVIFGDSGVMFKDDDTVTVRMHSDFSMSARAVSPTADWRSILGESFDESLNAYRASNAFSTSALFPVHKSGSAPNTLMRTT
jgi:hypothetical protein